MDQASKTHDFLTGIPAELRRAPRSLIAFAIAGLVSVGLDMLRWSHGAGPRLENQATPPLLVIIAMTLVYVAGMRMIGRTPSWRSAGKYLATLVLMFLPMLVALALLVTARTAGLFLAVPFVLAALFVMSFLQGWPLLQATSTGWIGPARAWSATRGLRLQLVLAAILIGAINRSAPDIPKAADLQHAVLLAAGGGVVVFVSLMTTTAVAVLACRHMQAVLAQTALEQA